MKNFEYYVPTKVAFGAGVEKQVGKHCLDCNAKKVLIHYGSGSVLKSGLLDIVINSLKDSNIEYVTLGGVKPNPKLSLVRQGIKLCKDENVDLILAVGGGSTIDSAKSIGFGVKHNGDVWNLFTGQETVADCVPIATILTLAAAGSEMSGSCVLTNDITDNKLSYGHDSCRPVFSLLNPELTYTLPEYQTKCGIVDIMIHTLERYFTTEPTMEITDRIGISVLKNMIKNAPLVITNPSNYTARAEIMWTGSLSHNDLTGCGGVDDWATHDIEHTLSGEYDVAHGAGLSALWSSWARYVIDSMPSRFATFAKDLFGLTGTDDKQLGLAGILALESFFKNLSMPVKISDLNISLSEDMMNKLANLGTNNDTKTIGSFKKLNSADLVNIYKLAK